MLVEFSFWSLTNVMFGVILQFSVSNIKSDLMNGDCLPVLNDDAPVYVVIGDGGNVEGLASQ